MYKYLKEINSEFFQFDSQEEQVVDVLKCVNKHYQSAFQSNNVSQSIGRAGFVGREFSNWQQVRRAMGELWPKGMTIYSEMMRELESEHIPKPKSIRRSRRWSEDNGDEVSVDRLMRGQTYWDQSYREARPGPMNITLVTDIATSGCVPHDEILWRGAAMVLLTELLEQAGYRVELWTATWCKNAHRNGRGCCIATNYKRSGDPLDVSTLINGVSGWYYRTIFFGSYNISDSAPCNGLGDIQALNEVIKYITPDEKAIVVKNVWDRNNAVRFVRSQLREMFSTQS